MRSFSAQKRCSRSTDRVACFFHENEKKTRDSAKRPLATVVAEIETRSMQAELTHRADTATAEPGSLALPELRELAIRADSSNLVERDPAEAALVWRALVDGRSTVVDHFDAHGRRYFIVRRRQASSKLTSRERQVLYHAALGYSGKRIAYEIGISQSTVALHLKSAANKMGYRSRVCLVLALAAARSPRANYRLGSPPK